MGTWQDRYEQSGPLSRQPSKPSARDSNLRETSRELRDKHETNYSNHRDHSRPRARDCSSDKRYRDSNTRGSSDQNVYRDYRSRDPSRGSSRDSLDQTSEDNRRRSCGEGKPTLQRQGTFTGWGQPSYMLDVLFRIFIPPSELRKSRPQSAEFSQSPSPRPGRPLSGPPLVSSQSQVFNWTWSRSFYMFSSEFMLVKNLRILMSQWVEPAERLLHFHGSSLPLNVWKLKTDTYAIWPFRQVSETSSGKTTRLQVNPAVQERQEQVPHIK